MKNKIFLTLLFLAGLTNNTYGSNTTSRLIIGSGTEIKSTLENEGIFSPKLIVPTENDITIDTDARVKPTIVGSMGDYKTYGKNILGKIMQEKNIKQFDAIIFEHTPSVESLYVRETINQGEFSAFNPKVFERREKKAGINLNEYFKAFNGTFYNIIIYSELKSGGNLTILSRRFDPKESQEVWNEWCKSITIIADLKDKNNEKNLKEQAFNQCKLNPQQTVEDYYKLVLHQYYDDIKIEFVEDKEYKHTKYNVRQDFKFIKVTATKK